MRWMYEFRKARSTLVRRDMRFIRTIQAPQQIVFDKYLNRFRLSSAAFGPSSSDGYLSGELEELFIADGLPLNILYPNIERAVGVAAFRVQDAIGLGLVVRHDPATRNWYHAGVGGSFKGRTKEKLRDFSKEMLPLDQAAARRFQEELGAAAAMRASPGNASY